MSIQAVAWVLDRSTARLGARLALLSVANHANPRGEEAFPAIDTIAREAGLSRRQVVRVLHELVRDRHLEVTGQRANGVNIFRVVGVAGRDVLSPHRPDDVQDLSSRGDIYDIEPGTSLSDLSPEPSLNRPEPPEGQIAIADADGSASNGKAKSRHLADVLNVGLVTAMLEHHPSWERTLTWAGLQGLARDHGPKAVNAGIEALYENQDDVSAPFPYVRAAADAFGSESHAASLPQPGTSREGASK